MQVCRNDLFIVIISFHYLCTILICIHCVTYWSICVQIMVKWAIARLTAYVAADYYSQLAVPDGEQYTKRLCSLNLLNVVNSLGHIKSARMWPTKNQFFVFGILITILLALAQSLMCSNFSGKLQLVFSGISRLVSSAYFMKMLTLDMGSSNRDGPIPEHCTID